MNSGTDKSNGSEGSHAVKAAFVAAIASIVVAIITTLGTIRASDNRLQKLEKRVSDVSLTNDYYIIIAHQSAHALAHLTDKVPADSIYQTYAKNNYKYLTKVY